MESPTTKQYFRVNTSVLCDTVVHGKAAVGKGTRCLLLEDGDVVKVRLNDGTIFAKDVYLPRDYLEPIDETN